MNYCRGASVLLHISPVEGAFGQHTARLAGVLFFLRLQVPHTIFALTTIRDPA